MLTLSPELHDNNLKPVYCCGAYHTITRTAWQQLEASLLLCGLWQQWWCSRYHQNCMTTTWSQSTAVGPITLSPELHDDNLKPVYCCRAYGNSDDVHAITRTTWRQLEASVLLWGLWQQWRYSHYHQNYMTTTTKLYLICHSMFRFYIISTRHNMLQYGM
jgi:hypothetical protein